MTKKFFELCMNQQKIIETRIHKMFQKENLNIPIVMIEKK